MTVQEPLSLPMTATGPFDPPDQIMAMRAGQPIARVRFENGGLGWVIARHETIRHVLTDPRFSARQELRRDAGETLPPAPPGVFIGKDPPDHTRYRHLLIGQFTVRRMKLLTSRIGEIAREHLDRMAAAGSPADLIQAYAAPIPAMTICELLGVPYDFRDEFARQATTMARADATMEEKRQAVSGIISHLADLVRKKRSEPTDDLLGGLASEGNDLTDEELANMAFLLLGGGLGTTVDMLGLGTFALLHHPEQIPKLTDPATVDHAVEELLRYLTTVRGTIRTALEDVEVDGAQIRAGESVLVSLAGGNRDAARYADPDTLDVSRSAAGHLSFGHGIHQCLGQQLARVEMRVGFAELFRRFPDLRLAVAADDVRVRDDIFHGVDELPVAWGAASR